MIKIIVALSVANVLRWHYTTMNRMVALRNLRGAGPHTKLGKRKDEYTAYEVSQFIINRRRIIYAATKSTGSVGIIEIYQEYITCNEIVDAIEQVVYDFCNK